MRLARFTFATSALLAVAASIYILCSPVTISEVRATGSADGSLATKELTRYASWYQVQGAWGVVVLVIFAALFVLVAFLALRKRYVASAVLSVLAGILVLLAGFSVGLFYFPAAAFIVLGWLALGVHWLLHARESAAA